MRRAAPDADVPGALVAARDGSGEQAPHDEQPQQRGVPHDTPRADGRTDTGDVPVTREPAPTFGLSCDRTSCLVTAFGERPFRMIAHSERRQGNNQGLTCIESA
ncbi:hypothetical protein GCM10010372_37170 [Streptomyces tauricus]|nr:hypothetical protein GCM10010372_37170 [Streptomyces tauricus]